VHDLKMYNEIAQLQSNRGAADSASCGVSKPA
jgi:hypothetical protein